MSGSPMSNVCSISNVCSYESCLFFLTETFPPVSGQCISNHRSCGESGSYQTVHGCVLSHIHQHNYSHGSYISTVWRLSTQHSNFPDCNAFWSFLLLYSVSMMHVFFDAALSIFLNKLQRYQNWQLHLWSHAKVCNMHQRVPACNFPGQGS